MIQKQEEGGEKYLEVETGPGEDQKDLIKDLREAFRRGLPIRAPAEVAREFGFPGEQEDVGSTADVIAAGRDPYEL